MNPLPTSLDTEDAPALNAVARPLGPPPPPSPPACCVAGQVDEETEQAALNALARTLEDRRGGRRG